MQGTSLSEMGMMGAIGPGGIMEHPTKETECDLQLRLSMFSSSHIFAALIKY